MVRLVPELCRVAGLTNDMRRDMSVKQAIIRHSRMEPSERKRRITEFLRKLTGYLTLSYHTVVIAVLLFYYYSKRVITNYSPVEVLNSLNSE